MKWSSKAWRGAILFLWGPGALSAQVFNYEPYDDSDLLGDFERPKKLHFGMNINVVKAGGASSVFYNGTGLSDLGDVFRELISIPERLDWNSVAGGRPKGGGRSRYTASYASCAKLHSGHCRQNCICKPGLARSPTLEKDGVQ